MSLLSETVSTVTTSPQVVSLSSLSIPASATSNFTLLNGALKQAVGYVVPSEQEWTPVFDINTMQPLELPQSFVSIIFFVKAIEPVNSSDLQLFFTNNLDDPSIQNYQITNNIPSYNYPYGFYSKFSTNVNGYSTLGLNYIVCKNNAYNLQTTTGVFKVVLFYF